MTLLLFPQKTEISNSYRNILTSKSQILYNLNKSLTVYRNKKRRTTFIQPFLLVKNIVG